MSTSAAQWRLSQAIHDLRQHISSIRQTREEGGTTVFLASMESTAQDATATTTQILSPVTDPEDVTQKIDTLDQVLVTFEQRLRERGQWHIPTNSNTSSPEDPTSSPHYLDLHDLEEAISILSDALDTPLPKTPPPTSPYKFFTSHTWLWDSTWFEFHCTPYDNGHVIYISHCTWDDSIQNWRTRIHHGLEPEEASARLGCWEDWLWDEQFGEWYLPMPDATEEKTVPDRLTASEWMLDEEGNWRYVARGGQH